MLKPRVIMKERLLRLFTEKYYKCHNAVSTVTSRRGRRVDLTMITSMMLTTAVSIPDPSPLSA